MTGDSDYLFVFGTLREKGGAGSLITGLGGVFQECAILSGWQVWMQGWIPYIIPHEGSIVTGDLVRFPLHVMTYALPYLDEYEGYSERAEPLCRYLRRRVNVQTENAPGFTEAWCYVSSPFHVRPHLEPGWELVPSGDYVQHFA